MKNLFVAAFVALFGVAAVSAPTFATHRHDVRVVVAVPVVVAAPVVAVPYTVALPVAAVPVVPTVPAAAPVVAATTTVPAAPVVAAPVVAVSAPSCYAVGSGFAGGYGNGFINTQAVIVQKDVIVVEDRRRRGLFGFRRR